MTPLIYNFFPRLAGPTTRWPEHASRAAAMSFNWFYINPWHYPGFSGSLYAPKEFRRLNPLFVPPGEDDRNLELLRSALSEIRGRGLRPMMDLVVNHTSRDAALASEHPEWYVRDARGELVSPSVTDPDDPSKVTVWGDLAEIDNAHSSNRDALWSYWADLVRDSIALGFQGFRCDAAYKVPSGLWRHLIEAARVVDPEVEFFAETLGAPVEDVLELRDAGFDYIFNSSKWWDFREPWALDQHEKFRGIAPSIAFPESHDTTRLAADTGGNIAVQRQRYAFAAGYSAGVMLPIGYEYGFRRQVNVVQTMPADWERKTVDLTEFIKRVNRLKLTTPVLQGEGALRAVDGLGGEALVLERRASDGGDAKALLLVNRDPDAAVEVVLPQGETSGFRLHRICRDDAAEEGEQPAPRVRLEAAEVAYLLPE